MPLAHLIPAICLVAGSLYRHSSDITYQKSASILGLLLALLSMYDTEDNNTGYAYSMLSTAATGFFLADKHWVDAIHSITVPSCWKSIRCKGRKKKDCGVEYPLDIMHTNEGVLAADNLTSSPTSESPVKTQTEEQSWYVLLPLYSSTSRTEVAPCY